MLLSDKEDAVLFSEALMKGVTRCNEISANSCLLVKQPCEEDALGRRGSLADILAQEQAEAFYQMVQRQTGEKFNKTSCRKWIGMLFRVGDPLLPWEKILHEKGFVLKPNETQSRVFSRMGYSRANAGDDFLTFFRWLLTTKNETGQLIKMRLDIRSTWFSTGHLVCYEFPQSKDAAKKWVAAVMRKHGLVQPSKSNRHKVKTDVGQLIVAGNRILFGRRIRTIQGMSYPEDIRRLYLWLYSNATDGIRMQEPTAVDAAAGSGIELDSAVHADDAHLNFSASEKNYLMQALSIPANTMVGEGGGGGGEEQVGERQDIDSAEVGVGAATYPITGLFRGRFMHMPRGDARGKAKDQVTATSPSPSSASLLPPEERFEEVAASGKRSGDEREPRRLLAKLQKLQYYSEHGVGPVS